MTQHLMILNTRSMSYLYFHPLPPTTRVRNTILIIHKPNTLDGDCIIVPVCLDSRGKIMLLRDGFDTKA